MMTLAVERDTCPRCGDLIRPGVFEPECWMCGYQDYEKTYAVRPATDFFEAISSIPYKMEGSTIPGKRVAYKQRSARTYPNSLTLTCPFKYGDEDCAQPMSHAKSSGIAGLWSFRCAHGHIIYVDPDLRFWR